MGAGATTSDERAARRAWVEEQFAHGVPTRKIEREGRDKFNCHRRTIRGDIAVARKRLGEAFAAETADAVRARSERILLDALEAARAKGDIAGQALIAQRLAEIHGAFKREVTLDVKFTGLADLLTIAAKGDGADATPKG